MFSWPTTWVDTDDIAKNATNRRNYDDGEMKAYASAAALRTLLGKLDGAGYSVDLYAHSQGNIVASEALRQEVLSTKRSLVHTYIASQAASSAGSYDFTLTQDPANLLHQNYALTNPQTGLATDLTPLLSSTPDIYTNFPMPININGVMVQRAYYQDISTVAQKVYNFYNPEDGAVADPIVWPLVQAVKPDDVNQAANSFSWYFDPSESQVTPYTYTYQNGTWVEKYLDIDSNGHLLHSWQRPLSLANPYDAYAVMAYGAESKTKGLGATPNVGGAFVKAGQVNVESAFEKCEGVGSL